MPTEHFRIDQNGYSCSFSAAICYIVLFLDQIVCV